MGANFVSHPVTVERALPVTRRFSRRDRRGAGGLTSGRHPAVGQDPGSEWTVADPTDTVSGSPRRPFVTKHRGRPTDWARVPGERMSWLSTAKIHRWLLGALLPLGGGW